MLASRRIRWVNSARGIAALSVVVAHFLVGFWTNPAATPISRNIAYLSETHPVPGFAIVLSEFPIAWGALGVSLFFLISGYVIPLSLQDSTRFHFLTARLIRILPTYVVGYLVTCLIVHIMGDPRHEINPASILIGVFPGLGTILNVRLVEDGIVWTLVVEVTFYLLFLIFFKRLADSLGGMLLVVAGCLLVQFVLESIPTPEALAGLRTNLLIAMPQVPFMLIGTIWARRKRLESRVWVATLFSIFFGCVHLLLIQSSSLYGFDWEHELTYLAVALFFSLASISSVDPEEKTITKFFADISYPLYVSHATFGYALISVLVMDGFSPEGAVILTCTLAILLAVIIHKFVEEPTLKAYKRTLQNIES